MQMSSCFSHLHLYLFLYLLLSLYTHINNPPLHADGLVQQLNMIWPFFVPFPLGEQFSLDQFLNFCTNCTWTKLGGTPLTRKEPIRWHKKGKKTAPKSRGCRPALNKLLIRVRVRSFQPFTVECVFGLGSGAEQKKNKRKETKKAKIKPPDTHLRWPGKKSSWSLAAKKVLNRELFSFVLPFPQFQFEFGNKVPKKIIIIIMAGAQWSHNHHHRVQTVTRDRDNHQTVVKHKSFMKFPFKANICTKKYIYIYVKWKTGQISISGTQTAGKAVATHENCQDTQWHKKDRVRIKNPLKQ